MCFISARAGETNHKLILGSVLFFFVVVVFVVTFLINSICGKKKTKILLLYIQNDLGGLQVHDTCIPYSGKL